MTQVFISFVIHNLLSIQQTHHNFQTYTIYLQP